MHVPVSLSHALGPLQPFLDDPTVIEICVNGPGKVFVERAGQGGMQFYDRPELTDREIAFISERIAGYSNQFVNEENPLLSAALPTGERVQIVRAPAAADGGAITIRKQVVKNLTLADYHANGSFHEVSVAGSAEVSAIDRQLNGYLDDGSEEAIFEFLRFAIRNRITICASGGTGGGKTTFLNAIIKEIPHHERIITIEDTRELDIGNPNAVALLTSRNDQGVAKADAMKLLEACLRMRPDRLLIGELRGQECFAFLRAVNTGHPGSLTSVHANGPVEAYEQMALMITQGGVQLPHDYLLRYLHMVIPVIVQIGKFDDGRPGKIREIFFTSRTPK